MKNTRYPVIGVLGPKGAGKTTVAKMLIQDFGYERLSLADPIKHMLLEMGLNERQLWGDQKEKPCPLLGGQTPRYAMQTLGAEWGRETITADLWLNLWRKEVESRPTAEKIVVDDCRFPNEIEAVQSYGGILIEVQRTGHAYTQEHKSETRVNTSAHVLVNASSFDDLRGALWWLMDEQVSHVR